MSGASGGALAIPGAEDRGLGLALATDLSEADWIEIGRKLALAHLRLPWPIADWAVYGAGRWGEKYDRLIEATGFSNQSLRDMAWVGKQFQLSRRRDNLSFAHRREAAALKPADRETLLDRAAAEGWPRRKLRTEVARFRRTGRLAALAAPEPLDTALDDRAGSYNVIYADPPWVFAAGESERSASAHYPVLGDADIAALPVSSIAAPDAVLYLWATAPGLERVLRVMAAWGFDYSTHMVWSKDRAGMGLRVRNRHELLLIGTRGALPAPAPGDQPDSAVGAPRGAHSAKPDLFRVLIERAYPGLPRVELFARGELPEGWDGWGDEYRPVGAGTVEAGDV